MMNQQSPLEFRPIPRVENLSAEEFKKQFMHTNRPVVFKDLSKDWKARTLWTPEYFLTEYGDQPVKVYDSNFGTPGRKYMSNLKTMRLGEYLQQMLSGKTTLRLFLYNMIKVAPELKEHVKLPTFSRGFSKNFMFMFFGAQGSITQMHYDIDLSHVFHTAFTGRKRFYLYPPSESKNLYRHPFTIRSYVDVLNPDFERYPKLKEAVGDYVELEPGETLFIPAGYWHHVVYDEASIALSLRCAHQNPLKRLEGIGNIIFFQLVDRLVNKICPQKWFLWKEKRADQLAQA
jgi:hypothetical protein